MEQTYALGQKLVGKNKQGSTIEHTCIAIFDIDKKLKPLGRVIYHPRINWNDGKVYLFMTKMKWHVRVDAIDNIRLKGFDAGIDYCRKDITKIYPVPKVTKG